MIATPLQPFGLEIEGVELGSVEPSLAARLVETISRNRVVVFRDQTSGDAGLVDFLGKLGELTFTEGEVPVAGAPNLNVVSNVGRATPPRSVFHTDTSYVPRPPAFTALRVVISPPQGGATLFSDQVAVARRLPARIRDRLSGLTVLHGASGLDGESRATRQPLLRRHPVTGEVALFLSTPERCTAVSGLDDRTSKRLVAALYRYSIRPSGLYRHEWRPGDVVVWDDRTTMHRADHDDVVGDRILHRGLVLGEEPILA